MIESKPNKLILKVIQEFGIQRGLNNEKENYIQTTKRMACFE